MDDPGVWLHAACFVAACACMHAHEDGTVTHHAFGHAVYQRTLRAFAAVATSLGAARCRQALQSGMRRSHQIAVGTGVPLRLRCPGGSKNERRARPGRRHNRPCLPMKCSSQCKRSILQVAARAIAVLKRKKRDHPPQLGRCTTRTQTAADNWPGRWRLPRLLEPLATGLRPHCADGLLRQAPVCLRRLQSLPGTSTRLPCSIGAAASLQQIHRAMTLLPLVPRLRLCAQRALDWPPSPFPRCRGVNAVACGCARLCAAGADHGTRRPYGCNSTYKSTKPACIFASSVSTEFFFLVWHAIPLCTSPPLATKHQAARVEPRYGSMHGHGPAQGASREGSAGPQSAPLNRPACMHQDQKCHLSHARNQARKAPAWGVIGGGLPGVAGRAGRLPVQTSYRSPDGPNRQTKAAERAPIAQLRNTTLQQCRDGTGGKPAWFK